MNTHNYFTLITHLEGDLKATVTLVPIENLNNEWRLDLHLFYRGEPAGHTSFNLHGYTEEEAHDVARNIRQNDFMLREIDEYLWGESD